MKLTRNLNLLFCYPAPYRYNARNIIVSDNIRYLMYHCRKKKKTFEKKAVQPIVMTDEEMQQDLYMFDKNLYVFREYNYIPACNHKKKVV